MLFAFTNELLPHIIFTGENSLITNENMRGDLQVVGMQGSLRVRQAASATRVEAGEPMHSLAALTTGTSDTNVYVLAAADSPVVGTHKLGGVANKGSQPFSTGTVVASEISLARPVAHVGVLR